MPQEENINNHSEDVSFEGKEILSKERSVSGGKEKFSETEKPNDTKSAIQEIERNYQEVQGLYEQTTSDIVESIKEDDEKRSERGIEVIEKDLGILSEEGTSLESSNVCEICGASMEEKSEEGKKFIICSKYPTCLNKKEIN